MLKTLSGRLNDRILWDRILILPGAGTRLHDDGIFERNTVNKEPHEEIRHHQAAGTAAQGR